MSKALGSWSGMRKYLEQEMLCESLKGRIRYGCTSYPSIDDGNVFEICVDGKLYNKSTDELITDFAYKE